MPKRYPMTSAFEDSHQDLLDQLATCTIDGCVGKVLAERSACQRLRRGLSCMLLSLLTGALC